MTAVCVPKHSTIVPGCGLPTHVYTGRFKGVAKSIHLNSVIMSVDRQKYLRLAVNATDELLSSLEACNL